MSDEMLPKDVAPLQPIHTLQTDLQDQAARGKISKVEMIVQEEREKQRVIVVSPPVHASSSHTLKNLAISLVSIVVVAGAGYGIFMTAQERGEKPPVTTTVPDEARSLLTYNSTKGISFTGNEGSEKGAMAKRLIEDAKPSGSGVTFFKTSIPMRDVLSVLSPSMPSDYRRTLLDDDFFGSLSEGESGNFVIIKLDSYDQAFAGQLEWEKTMGADLLPLFSAASSSVARFDDKIISNHDARVALNAKGQTLFAYGFYRNDAIIFARNEATFRAVYEMLLRQNI